MSNLYQKHKAENKKLMDSILEKHVFFAFNPRQFQEGCEKLGVKYTGELYRLGNTGGFYKKTDAPIINKMFDDMEANYQKALEEGGVQFAKDMFGDELDDHEFSYTRELDETLMSLSLTPEEIAKNPVLMEGLRGALKDRRCGYMVENWEVVYNG